MAGIGDHHVVVYRRARRSKIVDGAEEIESTVGLSNPELLARPIGRPAERRGVGKCERAFPAGGRPRRPAVDENANVAGSAQCADADVAEAVNGHTRRTVIREETQRVIRSCADLTTPRTDVRAEGDEAVGVCETVTATAGLHGELRNWV